MAPRKRLRPKGKTTTTKPTQAPQEAAEEVPEPAHEFAHEMERYRDVERQIAALKASIADEVEILEKRRDNIKANLTDLLETTGVKTMEGDYGKVTLVRPTRHEVDDEYLREHLPAKTWKAITETTTSIVKKKFEQAIAEGQISPEIFEKAVTEVPASKGHTKVTLRDDKPTAR